MSVIYKVIKNSYYAESGDHDLNVEIFRDKELAEKYLKEQIEYAKQDIDENQLEEYCVEETNNHYERYLDGYYSQDNISIYLKEDLFYEDKLEKENEIER